MCCCASPPPNFLSNSGRSKAEFDSTYIREILEKQDVILPIWLVDASAWAKLLDRLSRRFFPRPTTLTTVGSRALALLA
jgi:hypothetical protein